MTSPLSRRVAGVLAATLAGIPVATAGFLRLKYGPTVFQDLVDIRGSSAVLRVFKDIEEKNVQLCDFFEEHARNTPDKILVLYKDEVLTYGELDRQANQLAHFVQRSQVAARMDTVAIFMLNEPSFVVSWLAFTKLGLRIALLNYNLRGDVLLHCIKACNVKAIACSKDPLLLEALGSIKHELDALGTVVWVPGGPEVRDETLAHGLIPADTRDESCAPIPPTSRRQIASRNTALYIFTSGTTGVPKPAKVTHYRIMISSYASRPSVAFGPDDVIYCTLPLYHTAAFVISFAGMVRVGGRIVLSNFSARRFWDDVRKYKATVIPYIGELCRYLLAQPPRMDDGKYSHKIRYALGNGMAADIWEEFQKRFNIKHIHEFYGSTEGTYSFVNLDGKVGSVGRYPPVLAALTDVVVRVQCDMETAEPLRGSNGLCLLAPKGQTGLMLFRLNETMRFDGYQGDESVNQKKLVRNVKKHGDVFFNTGDLMLLDKDYYLYFKDRLGDTFRWKGENVATTEVAQVLNLFVSVEDTNVYGVQVPGNDGKAGMAAINLKQGHQLDPKGFYDHVVRSLPLYACPKFLRIMKEMEITGTFKHKKTDLAREGFDPNVISDPLFFMDVEKKTYAPLDKDAMRRIVFGKARL
ncbi:very long-chain acyl-CoA synthetase-like [Acanthaster planci]|uniref:long-chain-fatty-acid--CoA ligase n=1 Tax=Acanthaster planci TaxID=133434 RepID=A0A8B8A0D9_ACAPL|nr:very long-chain acyl-CoA synthetase-like [Acanthaster planci]